MKNKNKIFFVLLLLILLITVSTISATDDNTTVADDTHALNAVSSESISTEAVQTGTNEQVVSTKNMEKHDKKIKKDSVIIDGIEYTNIYENQDIGKGYYDIEDNTLFNNCTINTTTDGYIYVYNGNLALNNCQVIDSYITSYLANITMTNCSIKSNNSQLVIENYRSNLKLINCNLSDNTYNYVKDICGYLLMNAEGNLILDNVTVSNNSINFESIQPIDDKYGGLIMNTGNLTVYNSNFSTNHVGDSDHTDAGYNYGYVVGCGIIYNKNRGNISIYNSTFDNNIAGHSGSCIYMTSDRNTNAEDDKLIIDNTSFTNNTARVQGGALYLSSPNATITNSYFENNNVINQINTGYAYELGGGAIYTNYRTGKSNLYVENTTFKNNSGYQNGSSWSAPQKEAIINFGCNLTLNNDTFENSNISSYSNDWNTNFFTVLNNSNIANESRISIAQYMRANITNNRFTNNIGSLNLGTQSYPSYSQATNYQEYITNNTFINNTGSNTVQIGENIDYTTIADNTYQNTSIGDTLELNIPEKIYTDEPITITGTYTINNPEYYDEDILKQNKFQVYINDELVDTVNTLEFTITPTTRENMLITIQPSISQTKKSAVIQASTLNITLEPITATIEETTTLTAEITLIEDNENIEVNSGRVYFKVNGKILRDADTGRILYADVTDNTATLDYSVPKTWNEDTTIEAVFTGNDDLPQKASNTVNPTITAPETSQPEFSVADTTAVAGEEVTITVTTKNLDNGKVVLKVNGKTVKADDGKLYAKVSADATTFTYSVPKTLKAGDYTIKAVYTSGATKLESVASLMIG